MEVHLNLLDLPAHVLEKIFLYCYDPYQSYLIRLTECNKFIKNFIEKSTSLIEMLYLSFEIRENVDVDQFKSVMEACLASTRKYKNVCLTDRRVDLDKLEELFGNETIRGKFKALIEKNSATIRIAHYEGKLDSEIKLTILKSFLLLFKSLERLYLTFHRPTVPNDQFERRFWQSLQGFNLNLKSLWFLSFTQMAFDFIMNFIETQGDIVNIGFGTFEVNVDFLNRISNLLNVLQKLKSLSIIYCSTTPSQIPFNSIEPWNTKNLESLELRAQDFVYPENQLEIAEIIFQTPSHKLKVLLFDNFNFRGYDFEPLVTNYQNLESLSLEDSRYENSYRSDDFFLILRHLKKLKVLKFTFPEESRLNTSLFGSDEDFILPKIEEVGFIMNKYIKSNIIIGLAKYLTNCSEFSLRFAYNLRKVPFNYRGTLESLTKQLPNLEDLEMRKLAKMNLSFSFLHKIFANLIYFNEKPERFKVNSKPFRVWMRKSKEKSENAVPLADSDSEASK